MQVMERSVVAPVHKRPRRVLPWPLSFYQSAVGKKWVMALTGLGLMGFVTFHVIGNLKIYLGAEELNHYGEFLRELLVPLLPRTVMLWLLRVGLYTAFVLHIHAAYGLTRINRRARAAGGYVSKRDWQAATAASRSMRLTAVVILLFIVFHLADLTWGSANPDFQRGDMYRNVIASFQRPAVAGIYIVANLALGLHLLHGAWSMFQSLGVNNPKWNSWRRAFAVTFAAAVVVGNVSIPIAVVTGALQADDNPDCRVTDHTIETCELYENEAESP
jgi:succinate dehydrogenase / fumarate reductase, cytochrome b subunit